MTPFRRALVGARLAAALAVVAGLALTVHGAGAARRLAASTRRKLDDRAAVVRLQAELDRLAQARDLWEELDFQTLAPLDALARRHAGGTVAPEVVERDGEAAAFGWRIRRVEVVFHEAPLDTVGRFAAAAAAARPPWRLAAAQITAAPARGFARAVLTFEGLERPEAAP